MGLFPNKKRLTEAIEPDLMEKIVKDAIKRIGLKIVLEKASNGVYKSIPTQLGNTRTKDWYTLSIMEDSKGKILLGFQRFSDNTKGNSYTVTNVTGLDYTPEGEFIVMK